MANQVEIKGFFKVNKSSSEIHPGIVQMAEREIKKFPRSTGEWATFGKTTKVSDFTYGPKFIWEIEQIRPDGAAAIRISER